MAASSIRKRGPVHTRKRPQLIHLIPMSQPHLISAALFAVADGERLDFLAVHADPPHVLLDELLLQRQLEVLDEVLQLGRVAVDNDCDAAALHPAKAALAVVPEPVDPPLQQLGQHAQPLARLVELFDGRDCRERV